MVSTRSTLPYVLGWCAIAGVAASLDLAAPKSRCASHATQHECLAFRHNHECIWDVPQNLCLPDAPCEARQSHNCMFELTTGRGAAWDNTRNRCFLDEANGSCRWTDECLAHTGALGCIASGCSWERRCTPDDFRFPPGPGFCYGFCLPPGYRKSLAAPAGNATASEPPAAQGQAGPPRPRFVPIPPRQGAVAAKAYTPVVQLPAGQVQGTRTQSVDSYLGMPFAKSPVGDLRWRPPVRFPKWSGVFDATQYGASCPQAADYFLHSRRSCRGYTRTVCKGYSEDCLNLNVFSPRTQGKKAVMVWIFGGCFVSGSAENYDGSALASAQDVVVVTVNYRLGPFGWLAHDGLRGRDPEGSTGNYGLLDNVAALQWVQDNIAALGGDPSRVTIFGESAGAGTVSQLLGVESAWPYFNRVIMESGAGSFWTYMDMMAAYHNFDSAASVTSCGGGSSIKAKIACLLQASPDVLGSAVGSVYCRDSCSWTPVVDGVVVRGRTFELARQGELRPNTPIIAGYNLNDGSMFVPYSYYMSKKQVGKYFAKRFGPNRVAELKSVYPIPGSSPAWWVSNAFMSAQQCETDFSYACTARFLANYAPGPAYVYEFSQQNPTSGGLVEHGDEIPYVFFQAESLPREEDVLVSEMTMALWANFARTGDPNGAGLPHWPAWTDQQKVLLNISAQPAAAPVATHAGCSFFKQHWNYYKVCLPQNPSIPLQADGASGASALLV